MDTDDSNDFQGPPQIKRARISKSTTRKTTRRAGGNDVTMMSSRVTRSQTRLRRRPENGQSTRSQQALRKRDSNRPKQESSPPVTGSDDKPSTSTDSVIRRNDNGMTNTITPSHNTLLTPSHNTLLTQSTNVSSTISLPNHQQQSHDTQSHTHHQSHDSGVQRHHTIRATTEMPTQHISSVIRDTNTVIRSTSSHDPHVTSRTVSHGNHMTTSTTTNPSVIAWNRGSSSRDYMDISLNSRTGQSQHRQASNDTTTVRLPNSLSEPVIPVSTTTSSSSSRFTINNSSSNTGQSSPANVTPPTRRVSVIIDDVRQVGGVSNVSHAPRGRTNRHRLSEVELSSPDTRELRERLDRSTSFIVSQSRSRDRERERSHDRHNRASDHSARTRDVHPNSRNISRRPVPQFTSSHLPIVPNLPHTLSSMSRLPPSPTTGDIFTSRGSFGGVSGVPMPRPQSRLLPALNLDPNSPSPSRYEPPSLLPPWFPLSSGIGTEPSHVSGSHSGTTLRESSPSPVSMSDSLTAHFLVPSVEAGSDSSQSTVSSSLSPEFQSWITTGSLEAGERRPRPSFVVPSHRHAPSTQRGSRRGSNVEIIVVDDSSDDSDDDREVILTGVNYNPSHQIARDEAIARRLQAQFNHEILSNMNSDPRIRRDFSTGHLPRPVPAGPSVPSQSGRRLTRNSSNNGSGPSGQGSSSRPPGAVGSGSFSIPLIHSDSDDDDDYGGSTFIRDNFDALGSRINSWTPTEARTFLRLAGGMSSRHPRTREELMSAVGNMPPAMLAGAIMMSPLNFRVGSSYEDLLELAEALGPARPQGLRPEIINNLPLREHDSELEARTSGRGGSSDDDDGVLGKCVVCMCEYENGEKIRTLPCVHEFHQQCIDQWLQDHTTCPMCRVDIQTQRTRN